ncbi:MAG: hypothetical protein ILA23_07505 [Bacteroidales bacterium]|nr:hypothetical protein [Bacteroidales bacterium]
MEKNIEQILSEIKNKLAELEAALEAESAARATAEAAAAEAEAKAAAERAAAISAEPIDIDLLDDTVADTDAPERAYPLVSANEDASVSVTEEPAEETQVQPEPADESPKQSINDATQAVKSVNDRSATPHAWRTGLPGSPVRNILSAISLNDRVLFINTLFQEDPALFQSTIAQFNEMQTLDEAEAYIETHFPGWNLDSDIAFRFMMAVRRKLQ